jgi:8-oxo-dGTP pyrophosphatase MutT (NUDIX family)
MPKFKKEISAGGVIFRKPDSTLEIALISRENGQVWCLPKGLVDKEESLEQTALREVREETGLIGKLVQKIAEIKYWYYSKWEHVRISKTVHFYLLECLGGNVEEHDFEVDEVKWFPLKEAKKTLSYKSEREIVEKAEIILYNLPSQSGYITRPVGGLG